MNRQQTLEVLGRLTVEVESLPDDLYFLDVNTQGLSIHLNDLGDMEKVFFPEEIEPNDTAPNTHFYAERNGVKYVCVISPQEEIDRLRAKVKKLESETNPDAAIRDSLPTSEAAAT